MFFSWCWITTGVSKRPFPLDPRTNRTHKDDLKKAISQLMYRYILLHAILSADWPSLYRAVFHLIMDLYLLWLYTTT
jgi:hypothetical protein